MIRLSEHEVFAGILGKGINIEHFDHIGYLSGDGSGSYADCREYIISHADYCDSIAYSKAFGLTDTIKERWREEGIDFRIYIYLKNDKVIGGHIFKYKEIKANSHLPSVGYEMEPTQQEIRITKRILEYITNS